MSDPSHIARSKAACAFHYGTPISTCPSCLAAQGDNTRSDLPAAILAWCDHVESRATPNARVADPRVNAYADGFRDGVLEALAQVRQALLHDFDVAALDGRPAHAD